MPTRPPGTPTVDLTDSGNFGFINDAVFMTGLLEPDGPGFYSFVNLQQDGSQQGYNSDHIAQFDEKPPGNSVLLAEIPIFIGDGTNGTQEGVAYREFLLDLNEPNDQSKPYLSLDSLQIWQQESGNLNGFTPGAGFAGAHTNYLAYDLDAGGDHWIGLTDGMAHGSGQGEYRILIRNDAFINDAAHRYITLYSQFGLQSGWVSEGGFESWGLSNDSGNAVSALALTKNATVAGGTADTAGETITYTFRLDNVGNTAQTGVMLTDPSVSDLMRVADIVGNNDTVLDVDEVWSYTAHYIVTQHDIDSNADGRGVIVNTATAASNQAAAVSASAAVVVEQNSTLEFTKTPDVTSVDQAGDLITYTLNVTNIGTATLNTPVVTDPQFTITTPELDFNAPVLGPPLLFEIRDGDYNVGDTNENGIEDPGETFLFGIVGDENQNGIEDPGETFQHTNIGDTNQSGFQDIGETFQYYNLGDTNQNGVEDPGETFQFSVSHVVPAIDANDDGFNDGDTDLNGQLNVGETWQYSFSYTLTQADIDNGGVVDPGLTHDNTASVTTESVGGSASASVAIVQNPHVTLAKDASVAGGTADAAGEVISYTIAATNNGNVTLTNPGVSDPSVSDLAAVESGGFNVGDTDQDARLSVGETWQYTASYTVTQDDMDAGGSIDNTASIATDQGAMASDDASITIEQNAAMTLVKTALGYYDLDSSNAADVSDLIAYSFLVQNDGNVTLHNINLSDPNGVVAPMGSTIVALAPGASDTNYTATHTIVQADVDAGFFDNDAVAQADEISVSSGTVHSVLSELTLLV